MNNTYEQRLGTDKMLPLVFKMALPTVAAQFVNLLYNIVDRIFIGHIPNVGTDALAGVGITNSIIILISGFANFVGAGAAPLASIALEKGDRKRAGKMLGNGFSMLIFFTCLTASGVYIFMEPFLRAIGASNNTLVYAESYLSVYLIGTFFVEITIGLMPFINVQGRPAVAMATVIAGAVLNIALDPLFIFVFNMGVKGAALATVISQFVSAAMILWFLFSKNASLKIEPKYMRPDLKIIGAILALGVSPFVMAITESFIGFVLNAGLSKFGDIYVSALTVMQSAMQFVSVPLSGFGQGVVPILSYNYGHKNISRVKSCAKIMISVMFSVNLVLTLLTMIFSKPVASLFTDNPGLIAVVGKLMPVFLAGMTIFGLQRACQNTFVSLGQAKISLFIALLRKVFLLIPLALIFPLFMGVIGIYTAEAAADAAAATICTAIFIVKFPKILKKRELAD